MARAPRASISATTGQGVSRRAYQTAYAMGMHGTGSPLRGLAGVKSGTTGTGERSRRDYTKASLVAPGPMNIAYSEREFTTPSLDALKAVGGKAPKAPKGFLG